MSDKYFPTVSIVIRAKNEAKWIWKTLNSINSQSVIPEEIVLIDNLSEDYTISLAKEFGATKILTLKNYSPGRALNFGMQQTKSEVVVFLSAHCIPCDEFWLQNLISPFNYNQIAATYGRQIPLPFSADIDKSDLYAVFRNESKIQNSDGFMNNANSAILRKVWQQFKFDETVLNIEDRLWGETVISEGFKIAYEADAKVFHHNGMHKSGERADQSSTIQVLETMIFLDLQKDIEKYRSVFYDSFLPIIIGSKEDLINKKVNYFNEEVTQFKSYFLEPVTILIDEHESEIQNNTDVSISKVRQDLYVGVKNFILHQIKTLHPKAQYIFVIFAEGLPMTTQELLDSLNRIIFDNKVLVRIGTDCINLQFRDLFTESEKILYNFITEVDELFTQSL
jgi:glycosyltransferase involved in cell wall biosynthesis